MTKQQKEELKERASYFLDKKGREYSTQGNHRSAIACFSWAIVFGENSDSIKACYLVDRADEFFKHNKLELAALDYSRAIKVSSDENGYIGWLDSYYKKRGLISAGDGKFFETPVLINKTTIKEIIAKTYGGTLEGMLAPAFYDGEYTAVDIWLAINAGGVDYNLLLDDWDSLYGQFCHEIKNNKFLINLFENETVKYAQTINSVIKALRQNLDYAIDFNMLENLSIEVYQLDKTEKIGSEKYLISLVNRGIFFSRKIWFYSFFQFNRALEAIRQFEYSTEIKQEVFAQIKKWYDIRFADTINDDFYKLLYSFVIENNKEFDIFDNANFYSLFSNYLNGEYHAKALLLKQFIGFQAHKYILETFDFDYISDNTDAIFLVKLEDMVEVLGCLRVNLFLDKVIKENA